jgi:hypothetical protein
VIARSSPAREINTPNIAGQAYALTVVTPIIPSHEERLRNHLEQLSPGRRSPLASLPATHFARWVVFARPAHDGHHETNRPRSYHLLFDSCLDGDRDEYLEAMRTVIGDDVDAVWSHCIGYPGATDATAFATYFHNHQIDASLFLAAYPQATVADVRTSLELRRQLIDFAVMTQGFDAPSLLAAYRDFRAARARGS